MDTTRAFLPICQEGDARVVQAYLKILEKVPEKSDALERMQWFEGLEPLLKLLPRENVPPFLKCALRNGIVACASVSSVMKEKVCSLLEQYDLLALATPLPIDDSGHHSIKQFYDLNYEFNELEGRQQEYLSILSYLKLRNIFTIHELDTKCDRYLEIFQCVRDQVFGLSSQRLYANPTEKWELFVAALHHFEILPRNYEPTVEDASNKSDEHYLSPMETTLEAAKYTNAASAMELMKDLKNGEVIYRNLMSILMSGVEFVLEQRASQLHGPILEEAVSLSFQLVIYAFLKESLFEEACYPSLQQPLHEIILQESHQVVTLLEYVRYDKSQMIQRCSVKVMELLSARVPQLVFVLQEAEAVPNLTAGYAACLEARILEAHPPENPDEDIGSLILRLLLVNLCEPSPNLSHLLLGFDINQPVERTTLQPNSHFSCLTVILHALDTLARPEVNTGLHELGFKLLYELFVDPVTCGPMVDLLRNGKYDFLPKRSSHTSHDTCLERGNSSISGTDLCSSEAQDLEGFELQTCDLEPASGSASKIPSNSKPEVRFLNPEPLATRCTTKDNDGPGEGSVAALRSSWIQRLFPGMLSETVKPSEWKDKGKHIAPDYEDTEHLLIENAIKLAEASGSSPQLLGIGQDQGISCHNGDGGLVKPEVGSSTDLVYPSSNSSQPPPAMLSRQGLPPAREAYGAIRGLAGENFKKSAVDIEYLSESSQEFTGVGSQQASADHSAISARVTKELTCYRSPFDYPEQQDPHAHNVGYSQFRDADNAPPSIMYGEAEKKNKSSSVHPHILQAEVDTRSMQVEHHLMRRHSLSTRNVIRMSQQQERNRHDVNGLGTTSKPALRAESPSLRLKKSGLQPAGTRNISDIEYAPTGRAGGEGPLVNDLDTDENIGLRGQMVVSLRSSPLPPLSLFAPFKHSKERRSVVSQGKNKMAAGLLEDSLLTPLFSSREYKNDSNVKQGGVGAPEGKFDSTMFVPYKPLSSFRHNTGLRGVETPLTLTPDFAPFKTAEEQNRPSTSSIKTKILPLDPMGQEGEVAVGQYTAMDLDVMPESKAQQSDHMGELCSQSTAHGRTTSVYSSSPLPVVADQREAAMFSLNSGSRFNEEHYRVGTVNVHGSSLKGGCHTVNTTAIELSSKRPSLQEERTDGRRRCEAKKDLSITGLYDLQLSVSQGMRDPFQFDQGLQQQRLNTEAGTVRELRPCSIMVCEASSDSSPVPGSAMPFQQDGFKIEAASSSGVRGGIIIGGPSPLVKDAEREQIISDKEAHWTTATLNAMVQDSEVLSRGKQPMPGMEGRDLRQGKNLSGLAENVKLSINPSEGRSSRKRSHDARATQSQFVLQNPETISLAEPQNQQSAEDKSRTATRSQSWLQRWMPSSKSTSAVFKAHESCGSMPPGQLSSHAKNRMLVQGSLVQGERLDEAGGDAQEQPETSENEKASPWAGPNSNHRSSNPFFPGSYPTPSAAAMALVGAASRRTVPLPPQRVGKRIAVWPAIAGIQLRRTESGFPEELAQ